MSGFSLTLLFFLRVLRDHVRDRHGDLQDLVLLAHPVADHWSAMETAGIDDAVA